MQTIQAFSRFYRRMWGCAAIGALLMAPAGCESKPALAPVTGLVTHAGQPVAGANVMFQPETGIASGGTTGADGRFELQTSNDRRPGAFPGKHLVRILKPAAEPPPPEGGSASPPPPPAPPLELHASVEVDVAGPNEFTFEIP